MAEDVNALQCSSSSGDKGLCCVIQSSSTWADTAVVATALKDPKLPCVIHGGSKWADPAMKATALEDQRLRCAIRGLQLMGLHCSGGSSSGGIETALCDTRW